MSACRGRIRSHASPVLPIIGTIVPFALALVAAFLISTDMSWNCFGPTSRPSSSCMRISFDTGALMLFVLIVWEVWKSTAIDLWYLCTPLTGGPVGPAVANSIALSP